MEIDREGDLLEIGHQPAALPRREEHLGQLLIDRAAAAILAARLDRAQQDADQRDGIDAEIIRRPEAMILGRDQCRFETLAGRAHRAFVVAGGELPHDRRRLRDTRCRQQEGGGAECRPGQQDCPEDREIGRGAAGAIGCGLGLAAGGHPRSCHAGETVARRIMGWRRAAG
ncbi:hypothetical protein AcidC75_30450 [Acidisoma sp. C75]